MSNDTAWQNRIIDSGVADPVELIANERNWRTHPPLQRQALTEVLDRVGWVQQVIVNQRTGRLVDGHLRVELARDRGEDQIPVGYVDLDEDEEALVLATLDPLTQMARADEALLASLLDEVETPGGIRLILEGILASERSLAVLDASSGVEISDPSSEWVGMPEYDQQDRSSWHQVIVHFADSDALSRFARIVEQPLTDRTRSIWFPEAEIGRYVTKRYVPSEPAVDEA